jgi:hypothetical protein
LMAVTRSSGNKKTTDEWNLGVARENYDSLTNWQSRDQYLLQ